jgi:hypothetical protein
MATYNVMLLLIEVILFFVHKESYIPLRIECLATPNIIKNVWFFPKSAIIEIVQIKRTYNSTREYAYNLREIYNTYSGNGTKWMETGLLHNSVSYNDPKYYVVRDVFVNSKGRIIHNGIRCNYQNRLPERDATHGIVEAVYPEVVYLSHRYADTYGHLIKDTLGPLLYIPENIRRTVPFVFTFNLPIAYDFLKCIGINTSKMITFKNSSNYFFVEKLYTVALNDTINQNHGYTMRQLAARLRKELNLSNSAPTKYVLMNRNPRGKRYLINFGTFIEIVKKQFPMYSWEIWEDNDVNLYSLSRKWNSVKFILGPTGSNMDNCIFMQPLSVIHAIFVDYYDFPIISDAYSMNIFMVITRAKSGNHFRVSRCIMNIPSTVKDMNISLFAAKYGNFPPAIGAQKL